MGVGLRRVTEKVRQAAGLQGRNFQATSNLRCTTMMKEATDFAAHLKKCEKSIADMKLAAEVIINTTKATMAAPLPHVFEETAAGSGGEVRPNVSIGGPAFQGDVVAKMSQNCSAQLESQVLVPIKRWLDVFNALQGRLKEVDALRLEVDSRRHTVINLAADVDRLRAKLSKANGADGRLEGSLDDTIKKLQHKEGKLALTVQNFQEKEKSLAEDLSTLIKDAGWLRHYMASALKVQGETLLGAAKNLDAGEKPEASKMSAMYGGAAAAAAATTGAASTGNAASRQSTSGDPPGVPYAEASAPANPFLAAGVLK